MRIVLEIVEGAARGRKKALRGPMVLTVGRGEASDWMVPEDAAMSSIHFQISLDGDRCTVADLNSTNGTFIGGQRVTQKTLDHGDQILAGSTVFQLDVSQRKRSLIDGLTPTSATTSPAPTNDSPSQHIEPPSTQSPSVAPLPPETLPPETQPSDTLPSETLPLQRRQRESAAVPDAAGESLANNRPLSGAVIEVASGPDQGRKSILRSGQSVTVGSTDQSDFVVSDPELAAVHFSVSDSASGWQLLDFGSPTGTSVRGTQVSKTILRDGDRLTAGQTEFVVAVGGSAPVTTTSSASVLSFQQGVRDEDPSVRRAAIESAAWAGEPWLLDFCRQAAQTPNQTNWAAIEMLSILGLPSDMSLMMSVVECSELGSQRMHLLASMGHPSGVPRLIQEMQGDDVLCAVAAGNAFARFTGVNVFADQRVTVPIQDADQDEFAEEFQDQVIVPDPQKAADAWSSLSASLGNGTRIRQGIETAVPVNDQILSSLDMRSRWETCLRGAYDGNWHGTPFSLERFLVGLP